MNNSDFFNTMADKILNDCRNEDDFVSVYLRIKEYMKSNNVKKDDMRYYFDSGASEFLAMKTQRYRREMSKNVNIVQKQ